jgi:16S rRNA (adenine1518-N6/adenine1519-N6)-dimethyltransferase
MGSEDLRVKTFALVDAAFSQRRKTLRQALAEFAGSPAQAEALLVKAGISPQLRGEQLDINDFVKLAEAVS